MPNSSSLIVHVVHADGESQELRIDADSALIGSAAHADVRLPPMECAPEQLRIQVRGQSVFAVSCAMNPPVLVGGVPFTEGKVLSDSILRIGRAEIRISSVEPRSLVQKKEVRRDPVSMLIYAAAIVGFPLGIYFVFEPPPEEDLLAGKVPPPALWDEAGVRACRARSREAAARVAEEELTKAMSARERAPFRPADGVKAVGWFLDAAACFERADDRRAADAVRATAAGLKKRVAKDFHVFQVRLERSLATEEYGQARIELRALRAFIQDTADPYVEWLSNLERRITAELIGGTE